MTDAPLDDHPHGGGRGKSKGNRPPTSPWGTLVRLLLCLCVHFIVEATANLGDRPKEASRPGGSTMSTGGLSRQGRGCRVAARPRTERRARSDIAAIRRNAVVRIPTIAGECRRSCVHIGQLGNLNEPPWFSVGAPLRTTHIPELATAGRGESER